MVCYPEYIPVEQRDPVDVLNEERDQALEQIEQELAFGVAQIEVNPVTNTARIVGASTYPEGMSDLCILDALQTRNSLEWQLAAAHAEVQDRNFAAQHAHAHTHGHKH